MCVVGVKRLLRVGLLFLWLVGCCVWISTSKDLSLLVSSSMFLTSPFQPSLPSGILVSESYGDEFHFLAEFFWVVDSSSVYEYGSFHVFGEVFWFEFLEFVPFRY